MAAASGNDYITKYIYDYFVKDHLGNVRSTITTQPITSDYLAGYEVGQANIEQLVFENVAPVRSDKPGSTDPDDVMAARLNGNDPTTTIGTSLMLKVMPGDRFSIGVDAVYEGDYTQNNELTGRAVAAALMSTLTGGINYDGNATADIPDNVKTIQNIFGNPNLPNQLDGLMASTNDVNAPKAHLNYLFFDSKFNLVSGSSGAVQVQGGAVGWQHLTPVPLPNPGTPVCNNCLTPAPVPGNGGVIISPVPGYLVVYIDNQTIGKDVYFDHLMVEHYTSEVLEENHYYPFGLTVSLDQNTSVTANPYKLTTKELESHFDLNSYDFGARMFDMDKPFWGQIDELAEKHYDISPYAYCGNNPARYNDPDGMDTKEYYDNYGDKIGQDKNGNDGNVQIVTDQNEQAQIAEDTKNNTPTDASKINSGVNTTKTVIAEAVNVSDRDKKNGGTREEVSVVKKDGTVLRGDPGKTESSMFNGVKVRQASVVNPGGEGNTMIHSHMTEVIKLPTGRYALFNAEEPGPADPAAFKKYSLNIIVGPLGEAEIVTSPHGDIIRKQANGAVFYNSNAQPITNLTIGELKKIIAQ